jgi:hypothetical protein
MKFSRQLQIVLACGVSCGFMGCKTPTTWFSGSSQTATTAPGPAIQRHLRSSSTLKQNGGGRW